jgi:hypothetical protein
MDVLGRRALERAAKVIPFPKFRTGPEKQRWALGGDLVANTLYYALVGAGRPEKIVQRGIALGALAGLGALALPGPLGLGTQPSRRRASTSAMTFAWYFAGGLAAAGAYRALSRRTFDSRGRSS